jgi:predicted nucleic acid-binding protein
MVCEALEQFATRPIVSYVTIGELMAGVEMASTQQARDVRRETLRLALIRFAIHQLGPSELVDFATARRWGLRGNDAWVVASAKSLAASLITCDKRQADLATSVIGPQRVILIGSPPAPDR